MPLRASCRLAVLAALLAAPIARAGADIQIFGDRLTIGSDTVLLAFKGADIVRVKNRLTGEEYIRTTTPQRAILDMGMIKPPSKPYINFGWKQGRAEVNPESAQIQFNDQTRSIWMNVVVDQETNDITISIWGEANREGVTGLTWGMRGLDLTGGKLILPVQGGRYMDASVPVNEFSYAYPGDWEAQMAMWQTKAGGFVVYSRDDQARYKRVSMQRKGFFADILLETEAAGPFDKAGGVPQVEWRFNAYKGNWQVPANGYRNLMHFYRKPARVPAERAWVKNIRTVATIRGPKQDPKLLEALEKHLDPAKTLLYIPEWRRAGWELNYPDYDWNESVREFIDKARDRGFRVMLHADMTAVSPSHEDYKRLGRYQVCDPRNGRPVGKRWENGDKDPRRFAIINPASETWRNTLLARLRPVIENLNPDALFLAGAGTLFNDGNSTLSKRNFAEGCMAVERALLTAYPRLALGVDGLNELTSPYSWFAARRGQSGLPPHPISELLFGDHVLSFAHPELPDPDVAPGGWAAVMGVLEGQGVLPGVSIHSTQDLTAPKPGTKQLLDIARAWQTHDFAPYWQSDWGTNRFVWQGADGIPAAVEVVSGGTRLRVGAETLYRRITGVPTIASPERIPGWPGFDEPTLFGLDPGEAYAAMAGPRFKDALHIPVLAPGAMISWSQITPDFALFGFEPRKKDAASPFSFEVSLPPGLAAGTTGGSAGEPTKKEGRLSWTDSPATSWAAIFLTPPQTVSAGQDLADLPHEDAVVSSGIAHSQPTVKAAAGTSGSVEKAKALISAAVAGGDRVLTWALKLPEGASTLSFQAGLVNDTAGEGANLEVRVNGEMVWKSEKTVPGWQAGQADLSRWKGKNVLVQLVTRPKSEGGGDRVGWAELVVK